MSTTESTTAAPAERMRRQRTAAQGKGRVTVSRRRTERLTAPAPSAEERLTVARAALAEEAEALSRLTPEHMLSVRRMAKEEARRSAVLTLDTDDVMAEALTRLAFNAPHTLAALATDGRTLAEAHVRMTLRSVADNMLRSRSVRLTEREEEHAAARAAALAADGRTERADADPERSYALAAAAAGGWRAGKSVARAAGASGAVLAEAAGKAERMAVKAERLSMRSVNERTTERAVRMLRETSLDAMLASSEEGAPLRLSLTFQPEAADSAGRTEHGGATERTERERIRGALSLDAEALTEAAEAAERATGNAGRSLRTEAPSLAALAFLLSASTADHVSAARRWRSIAEAAALTAEAARTALREAVKADALATTDSGWRRLTEPERQRLDAVKRAAEEAERRTAATALAARGLALASHGGRVTLLTLLTLLTDASGDNSQSKSAEPLSVFYWHALASLASLATDDASMARLRRAVRRLAEHAETDAEYWPVDGAAVLAERVRSLRERMADAQHGAVLAERREEEAAALSDAERSYRAWRKALLSVAPFTEAEESTEPEHGGWRAVAGAERIYLSVSLTAHDGAERMRRMLAAERATLALATEAAEREERRAAALTEREAERIKRTLSTAEERTRRQREEEAQHAERMAERTADAERTALALSADGAAWRTAAPLADADAEAERVTLGAVLASLTEEEAEATERRREALRQRTAQQREQRSALSRSLMRREHAADAERMRMALSLDAQRRQRHYGKAERTALAADAAAWRRMGTAPSAPAEAPAPAEEESTEAAEALTERMAERKAQRKAERKAQRKA